VSTKRDKEQIQLLHGTLHLLIFRTLMLGPVHSHVIAKAIELNSDEVLEVGQGCGWYSVKGFG
jgi:PadR family transcriptional regulator, regulatory protein PadR